MPMTVTPDRIPEYLLLLDNDGWYSNIFAGSVVGDPLMEAAALNLPAPKRERQKKEGVQEKTVTQGTKPAALASPVSTVTIMPRTSTDPLSTLQAVSLTRWLVKWKTELVDERGESLLSAWTPKHVTALLRSWGWLDDGNLPTSLGRSKGVSTAQGIRSSGEIYAYSVYSAEAAENVLAALKPYFQAHNYSVEDIELPQPKRP